MNVYSTTHCTQSWTTATAYSVWRLVVRYLQSTKTQPLTVKYYPWCSSYRSQNQIFVENQYFSLLHRHSMLPLGGFQSKYCQDVWNGKTRMVCLPDGEKMLKICLFWQNLRMWQTDGHTCTLHDIIRRACTASHGKKSEQHNHTRCH